MSQHGQRGEFADDEQEEDEDLDDDYVEDEDDEDDDNDAEARHGQSSSKRRMLDAMATSAATATELLFNSQAFAASLRAQTMLSRQSSFAMSESAANAAGMNEDNDVSTAVGRGKNARA